MPTLYLDCDGFFASCEESADPALHGQPVGVSTTDPANPGAVLIAVNPEAKRRGAGKGIRARDARATVPGIAIREQRPELYVATHHAIARAVDTVLPGATSRSIDELAVDLEHSDDAEAILEAVKTAIRRAVGPIVTVSCGVAPSAYLAKTAAEANKPDAAVVWRPEDLPRVYAPLELCDLPGLGPATEARLRHRGIDTVLALHDAQPSVARWAWGSVIGADVHEALHGLPMRVRRGPRRRVSHGRVLEPKLRTWRQARPIMRFLVTCTLHRCASVGVAPGALVLEVISDTDRGWARTAGVAPTLDERAALRAVSALWDAIAAKAGHRHPPKRFTVTATKLAPSPTRQGALFAHQASAVQGVIDTVRKRFGARAITMGDSADASARYTGLKISFEHIPDPADFDWLGVSMPQVGPGKTSPSAAVPQR